MLSFHGTFFVLAREGGRKFWITLYVCTNTLVSEETHTLVWNNSSKYILVYKTHSAKISLVFLLFLCLDIRVYHTLRCWGWANTKNINYPSDNGLSLSNARTFTWRSISNVTTFMIITQHISYWQNTQLFRQQIRGKMWSTLYGQWSWRRPSILLRTWNFLSSLSSSQLNRMEQNSKNYHFAIVYSNDRIQRLLTLDKSHPHPPLPKAKRVSYFLWMVPHKRHVDPISV